MRVIGLTGYAGVGKDEAAKTLTEAGWQRLAFADPLREMLAKLDPIIAVDRRPLRLSELLGLGGWQLAKTFTETRRLLQVLGTEVGREMIDPNLWIGMASKKADLTGGDTVFTDVRFGNEAAMIRKRKGLIVRVTRNGVGPVNNHSSDRQDISADWEIANDGTTDDLWRKVWQVVDLLPNRAG